MSRCPTPSLCRSTLRAVSAKSTWSGEASDRSASNSPSRGRDAEQARAATFLRFGYVSPQHTLDLCLIATLDGVFFELRQARIIAKARISRGAALARRRSQASRRSQARLARGVLDLGSRSRACPHCTYNIVNCIVDKGRAASPAGLRPRAEETMVRRFLAESETREPLSWPSSPTSFRA